MHNLDINKKVPKFLTQIKNNVTNNLDLEQMDMRS